MWLLYSLHYPGDVKFVRPGGSAFVNLLTQEAPRPVSAHESSEQDRDRPQAVSNHEERVEIGTIPCAPVTHLLRYALTD